MNPAAPGGSAPARDNLIGAVLIVVAVIIGLVLLVKGYDQEGELVAGSDESEQVDESTTTTVDPAVTTTVAPAARPPAEVPVMVANAAGVAGAAGNLQTQLEADGYTQVQTTNASPVTTTLIYFAEGAQAEAEALATTLGTDPAAVRVLPASPPVDPAGALLLVVLGPDLAS